jgi:hypothetical protein
MFILPCKHVESYTRVRFSEGLHVHAGFNTKQRCVLPAHFIFVCLVILRTCGINRLFYFMNNLSVLLHTVTLFLYVCHVTSHAQTLSPQRGAHQNTVAMIFRTLYKRGLISVGVAMWWSFVAWIALGRMSECWMWKKNFQNHTKKNKNKFSVTGRPSVFFVSTSALSRCKPVTADTCCYSETLLFGTPCIFEDARCRFKNERDLSSAGSVYLFFWKKNP